MFKLFLSFLLAGFFGPAFAIYKCENNDKLTYGDKPCHADQTSRAFNRVIDREITANTAMAIERAERDKRELGRLQGERRKAELAEQKSRDKAARSAATRQKRCSSLALQKKWKSEDIGSAKPNAKEKAKKSARRVAEKYEMECHA